MSSIKVSCTKEKSSDKLSLEIELNGKNISESIIPSFTLGVNLQETIKKFTTRKEFMRGSDCGEDSRPNDQVRPIILEVSRNLDQVYEGQDLMYWRKQEFTNLTMTELFDQLRIKCLLRL